MEATTRNKLSKTLAVIQWVFIIIVFLLGLLESKGQSLIAETYTQKSILGIQQGYAVKFSNKRNASIGFFHQESPDNGIEKRSQKYPYTGIELDMSLLAVRKWQLTAGLKGGFINKNYFSLLPEINGKMKVGQNFALAFGAGLRMGRVTSSIKISLAKKI